MSLRTQDNAEMALAKEVNTLEILKRAREFQSGEGISAFESEANVREEVNRRSYKAGYTNKEGGPVSSDNIRSMPANDNYRKSYDKIKW